MVLCPQNPDTGPFLSASQECRASRCWSAVDAAQSPAVWKWRGEGGRCFPRGGVITLTQTHWKSEGEHSWPRLPLHFLSGGCRSWRLDWIVLSPPHAGVAWGEGPVNSQPGSQVVTWVLLSGSFFERPFLLRGPGSCLAWCLSFVLEMRSFICVSTCVCVGGGLPIMEAPPMREGDHSSPQMHPCAPPGCIPTSPLAGQVSPRHVHGPSPSPPSCPVLPISASSPPPSSCWEWRLHFSCHLHSQSIRTPQLSRLAELGGRRRRERVLWGLSPPHRSHSAPDCFLLRGAQPAGQGGSGNPAASLPLGTWAGGWGQQGWVEGGGQGRSTALPPVGEPRAPRPRPLLTSLIKRKGAGSSVGRRGLRLRSSPASDLLAR